MTEISARGRNGQVSFDGKAITITREGAAARVTHGRGQKVIPLRQVTAVEMKPVGFLTTGYIQFTIPGELSKSKGKGARTMNAARDENSVIFLKNQEPEFETLRQSIQTALADL